LHAGALIQEGRRFASPRSAGRLTRGRIANKNGGPRFRRRPTVSA